MKIQSKRYVRIILTVVFSFLTIHSYAVFEGRDEKLRQYSEVRNLIEVEQITPQKATDNYGGYDENPEIIKKNDYVGAIGDSPWLIVVFGLVYGIGLFIQKKKTIHVK